MNDDNDITRKGGGDDEDTTTSSSTEGPQPISEEELRDRMERAASRVLHEKLGKPLDETGKVDPSSIRQEELEDNAQELIFGMLQAFGAEFGEITNERRQAESPEVSGTAEQAPVEPATSTPSDTQPVPTEEATIIPPEADEPRPPTAIDMALKAFGEKIQRAVGDQLEKRLGVSVDDLESMDLEKLEENPIVRQLAGKLMSWTEAFSSTLEKLASSAQGGVELGEGIQVSNIKKSEADERVQGDTEEPMHAETTPTEEVEAAPTGEVERVEATLEKAETERIAVGEVEVEAIEGEEDQGAMVEREAVEIEGIEGQQVEALELDEPPQEPTAEEAPSGEDNVIDLEEWRQRLEVKSSSPMFKIGENLQETLNRFIEENVIPSTQTDAGMNLQLDESFFQQHGPALLGALLQDVAKNLIPPKVELRLPMTDEEKVKAAEQKESTGESGDEAAGEIQESQAVEGAASAEGDEAQDGSEIKVSLKFDMGSLLGGLFKKVGPPPPESEPTPEEDE